jgi:UDP-N-acetylmuramate dehydrogenase
VKKDLAIEADIPLAPLATMGVGGPARYLARIGKPEEIPDHVAWAKARSLAVMILGEGSNIVVADRGFAGLVLKIEAESIQVVAEDSESVVVRVAAGVQWDRWVAFTVAQGWWGLENMSLIPGTIGACPVQNVGAYGQECKNVIETVSAYDLAEESFVELTNPQCRFRFRTSIFNTTDRDRYIITGVTFRLKKTPSPCLTRKALRARIKSTGSIGDRPRPGSAVSQSAIRDAVIELRTNGSNLPRPNTLCNAGTFFRASQLPKSKLAGLLPRTFLRLGIWTALKVTGAAVKYASPAGVKIPSRLLIEACGLASLQFGGVGLYPSNPAVVTTGGPGLAKAEDILRMIRIVRRTVFERTGFEVPVEPNLIGFTEKEREDAFSLAPEAETRFS